MESSRENAYDDCQYDNMMVIWNYRRPRCTMDCEYYSSKWEYEYIRRKWRDITWCPCNTWLWQRGSIWQGWHESGQNDKDNMQIENEEEYGDEDDDCYKKNLFYSLEKKGYEIWKVM